MMTRQRALAEQRLEVEHDDGAVLLQQLGIMCPPPMPFTHVGPTHAHDWWRVC